MSSSRLRALVAVVAATVLSSCTGAISGAPHLAAAPTTHHPDFPSTLPTPVATSANPTGPVSSAPAPGPVATPARPTPGAASAARGCPATADYCARFTGSADGWPSVTKSTFSGGYSGRHGGMYRVAEKTNFALSEDAPIDLSLISHTGSVRVDVDMVASTLPGQDEGGVTCWEHYATPASRFTSAFLLQIGNATASIGMWDETNSTYHDLATKPLPAGFVTGERTLRLTARCIRSGSGKNTSARLSLAVNGTTVVSAGYPSAGKHYAWGVRGSAGVLAIGAKSDIYYDNFAITRM